MAGGQAALCNGSVVLRLEESDDWARLAGRVAHWANARKECEAAGRCASARVVFVVSSPIPGIRWAPSPVLCATAPLFRSRSPAALHSIVTAQKPPRLFRFQSGPRSLLRVD